MAGNFFIAVETALADIFFVLNRFIFLTVPIRRGVAVCSFVVGGVEGVERCVRLLPDVPPFTLPLAVSVVRVEAPVAPALFFAAVDAAFVVDVVADPFFPVLTTSELVRFDRADGLCFVDDSFAPFVLGAALFFSVTFFDAGFFGAAFPAAAFFTAVDPVADFLEREPFEVLFVAAFFVAVFFAAAFFEAAPFVPDAPPFFVVAERVVLAFVPAAAFLVDDPFEPVAFVVLFPFGVAFVDALFFAPLFPDAAATTPFFFEALFAAADFTPVVFLREAEDVLLFSDFAPLAVLRERVALPAVDDVRRAFPDAAVFFAAMLFSTTEMWVEWSVWVDKKDSAPVSRGFSCARRRIRTSGLPDVRSRSDR